jgi:AcrR family transcriptional regulator
LLVEHEVNNIGGVPSRGPDVKIGKVRVRRSPSDRRAEILDAAIRLALGHGLDQVTLRRIAEELGVAGSLVTHYFPAVDDHLAVACAEAARTELEQVFAEVERLESPRDQLAGLLRRLVDSERDAISALWMDAWHAGRRRPALADEVSRQTSLWTERLTGLVQRGRAAGQFDTADPRATAARIMAVVDGLTVQASMRDTIDYESVEQLVFQVAEREVGLPPGSLGR